MRSVARRRWLLLHRSVGLLVGSVLVVIGATGALMAFEDEIVAGLNRGARSVPVREIALLDPPELLTRLHDATPEQRVIALELPRAHGAAVRVTFEDARAEPAGARPAGRSTRYVDPYTAAPLPDAGTRGEAFFAGVRSLHRWLVLGDLGSRDVGRQVVGICTLALVLLGVSGLRLRGRLPLLFGLDLGRRARGRARIFRPHVAIGTWGLPVYVALAATGLTWTYPAYLDALHALTGVPPSVRPERRAAEASAVAPSLDLAWSTAARLMPEGSGLVRIRLPGGAEPVRVSYLPPTATHAHEMDTLTLDVAGTALEHARYAEQSLPARWLASRLALHTGAYFGWIGRTLVFVGASSLPLLVGTGVWLYALGHLRGRRRGERHTRSTPTLESERALEPLTGDASRAEPLAPWLGAPRR